MSKKKATISIVVGAILLCVVIVAVSMTCVGAKAFDRQTPDDFLSDWMSYISNDALLKSVVIPGSHDAGTVDMMWAARTQDKSPKLQMECGVRYFDIRVQLKKGKMTIFHGPISGRDFEPIIDDAKDFLQNNPSETLILDFQHFKGGNDAMKSVDEVLCQKLSGLMLANDTQKSDVDFINSLTLGEARGKAIVFWGNEFGDFSNTDYIVGKNYLFRRNNDAGTRGGSSLQSFYDKTLNRKTSKAYLKDSIDKYVERYNQSEGGLFVMQMQLTDPVAIIGPQFYEGTHTQNAAEFISRLDGKDYFASVNIIMRDFVGAGKSKQIIALNLSKGIVKTSLSSEFERKCA